MADSENIILIGPTGTRNNWATADDGPSFIDAVLRDAKRRYNIDPEKIYVFGHSNGARAALWLGIKRSDIFAAVAAHAGLLIDQDQHAIAGAARKIPVMIINGENDRIFKLEKVRETAQAFADGGHETVFYILRGHDHWYYTPAPFINAKAWQFLSRHRLEK